MAKRLQVTLQNSEYREIQRMARTRHISISEWVRRTLDLARRGESVGGVTKKLEAIRLAVQHEYPVSDIDDMLSEIDQGYTGGSRPKS